jgi:hypothetical protein
VHLLLCMCACCCCVQVSVAVSSLSSLLSLLDECRVGLSRPSPAPSPYVLPPLSPSAPASLLLPQWIKTTAEARPHTVSMDVGNASCGADDSLVCALCVSVCVGFVWLCGAASGAPHDCSPHPHQHSHRYHITHTQPQPQADTEQSCQEC